MDTELFGCSDYLPECSHSTMNYRKVITKLNKNNVAHVIQTMASMNYRTVMTKLNENNVTYVMQTD